MCADLCARLPEVDTESVCLVGVVFNKVCQCSESGSTGNEETTLVKLTDPVVFHCVSVLHCSGGAEIGVSVIWGNVIEKINFEKY